MPGMTTIERALQPSATTGRYIAFGTLHVSRKIAASFERAERYLSRDREAIAILYRLEHAKHVISVRSCADGNDRFEKETIVWDTHSALRTTSNGYQTPALGLLHEEDHALESIAYPSRMQRLQQKSDPRYDNLEEKRVIRGVERRAALQLGEGVRSDHRGTTYKVKDPALCRVFYV